MSPSDLDRDFERFCEQSDLRALSRVFDAAAPQLLAVGRHLAPSRCEVEDLLQATFVVAIERSASWDRARPVLPWLLGILAFEARKARARAGREPDPRRLEPRETPDPSAELGRREVRIAVDAALACLPESYAPIVRRHLLDGALPSELALELGLTPVNARTRLHRGLRLLREAMPQGFAGLGIWFWRRWSGPRAARGPVLERASQHVGRPVPLAYGSLTLVAALAAAPLTLFLPKLFDRAPSAQVGSAAPLQGEVRAPRTAAQEGTGRRLEPDSFPAARMRPAEPRDRLRGRLLRADGAPAVGVKFTISRWAKASEEGEPVEIDGTSDATGTFEFELVTQPDKSLRMVAELDGHATARWWFAARDPGSLYDVGEVRLERAVELALRIVDGAGTPLGAGWQGLVEVSPLEPGAGLENYFVKEACDRTTGIARFRSLPPRAVRVAARHPSGHVLAFETLDPSRIEGPFELRYDGPRLEERVTVHLRLPRGVTHGPAPEFVRLRCPSGGAHAPSLEAGGRTALVFDGVEEGAHELSVEDPLFASVVRAGLHAGSKAERIELEGSATLVLTVLDAQGQPPAGRWSLRAFGDSRDQSPASASIAWAEGARWPAEGVRLRLVPLDARMRLELEGTLERDVLLADVQPGETREVRIDLAQTGSSLRGHVLGLGGPAVADQTVRLVRGGQPAHARGAQAHVQVGGEVVPAASASVQVDAEGRFRFDGLEPGRWIVSTEWGGTLGTFVQCDVPQVEPLRLAPPTYGSVAGRLLFPEGARTEHVGLMVREVGGPRAGAIYGSLDPGRALDDDGRFVLGTVPTGEIELLLAVTDHERGIPRVLSWPLTRLQVEEGLQGPFEIDARAAFPASLTVEVVVDGLAQASGSVNILSRVPRGTETDGSARVMQSGRARVDWLGPGSTLELEFISAEQWRTWVTGLPGLRPSEERLEVLAISTLEREVVVLEAETGRALVGSEVRWLTGTLVYREPSVEESRWCPSLRSDLAGRGRLRLPVGRARTRASQGLRCEPELVEWEASAEPLVLRVHRETSR
jgi:RNA polymerase sigma-70 factor (ECF subfamily)